MKTLNLESGLVVELKSYYEEGRSTVYDYAIQISDESSGYVEVSEFDGDFTVSDLHIKKEFRNKGYGTQILLAFAEETGGFYLAPTDEDNQRLYERLGQETVCEYEIDQGYGIYWIQ